MKYHFPYTKIQSIKRPIIPIWLRNGKNILRYVALIDSGADYNIFHADLAPALGIELSRLSIRSINGIAAGKPLETRYTIVSFSVDGKSYYEAPVLFSPNMSESSYGVVGQSGFFNHFRVTFDYKRSDIELKTNNNINL